MWTFLDDVEGGSWCRMIWPRRLARHASTFEEWSRSIKRAWLEKIKWAKTDPTRAKRIAECAGGGARESQERRPLPERVCPGAPGRRYAAELARNSCQPPPAPFPCPPPSSMSAANLEGKGDYILY